MLKINNVSKNFRGVEALKSVSVEIESGSVLAIVGDNGAGKSTLMKCVSGALNPDNGSIFIDDHELTHANPADSRAAGVEMIYQDLALCRMQDVVTNVFLGCEEKAGVFLKRKSMATKCANALAELEIEIPANSIVGNLSGGQQQSVAIARAMISDPKLLIMDEPTAALAAKETQRVLKSITNLKERGVTVAMITHRLADIFEIADRILVMTRGEISYDLTPEETNLVDLTSKIIGE